MSSGAYDQDAESIVRNGVEVLLLDDDADALEELEDILDLEGYACETVSTVAAALDLIEKTPSIRVVVTDVHIIQPGQATANGVAFVSTAQEAFPTRQLSFIVLSGDATAIDASLRTGVRDFLTKPLIPEELIEAVRSALAAPQDRDDLAEVLMRTIAQKTEALQKATVDLAQREDDALKAAQQLRQMQEVDPQTGLATPARFATELDDALKADTSVGSALLRIELGGAKIVANALGRAQGDALLAQLADELRSLCEDDDITGRLATEEFAVFSRRARPPEALALYAGRIERRLADSEALVESGCCLVPRVGVSIHTAPEDTAEQMMMNAGLALQRARDVGMVQIYSDKMRAEEQRRRHLAGKLRTALYTGEITPWFQPQICIRTGVVRGFEALVRWIDPVDGMRSPAEFLPVAEESGMMRDLDRIVQAKAFDLLREVHKSGVDGCHIGVNFTAEQLGASDVVDALLCDIDRADLEPHQVGIEVLETAMLDDAAADPIKANIARLTQLGFSIELDDFGTGHAGLSSLRDLMVDKVKIDRSFVQDIDKDPKLQMFTNALIGLAKNLNIEVLAEGVERPEEIAWLRDHGCDQVQGFYISKPMSREDTLAWVASNAGADKVA